MYMLQRHKITRLYYSELKNYITRSRILFILLCVMCYGEVDILFFIFYHDIFQSLASLVLPKV